VASETLDFQGEPLQGLQIMGMLESRNLDFETIILTSVNEGILPSGKSNNSFIPYDLKKAYNLPTYKEKDAVYTYHFYRLLQRAKHIYILYNTEPDVLEGGEKSRLIHQLLTEDLLATVKSTVTSPAIETSTKESVAIVKDQDFIDRLQALATNGFSPSSLSTYIRNPIDFYKKYILGIDDPLVVEESIAANTFGTVIHDTLEALYLPFIGQMLTQEKLEKTIEQIPVIVKKHFSKHYLEASSLHGKNLIALQVILRYIENFVRSEIAFLKDHKVEIIALEKKMEHLITVPELPFPILLKGKIDRIDRVDGTTRIIDYKTGVVKAGDVRFTDWDDLTLEYKKNKAFQLLCYSLLYAQEAKATNFTAGIIPFKSLGSGILLLKEGKETMINEETLATFSIQLKKLILELFSLETVFIEKEA